MRFEKLNFFYCFPRSTQFLIDNDYSPILIWNIFISVWQRRGLHTKQVLALLRCSYKLTDIAKGLDWKAPYLFHSIWLNILPLVVKQLIFFCQIRYVALSRQLRKILKNKYRFAKQTRLIDPSKRLQATARFIYSFTDLGDESYRRAWRLVNVLNALLSEETHPLIESRNLQQKQALAALVTKQLGRKL